MDPLKMLYIAYESIRCSELLDELSVLEARICSLDEQLLPEVEMKGSPQEVLVRVTRTDLEVAGIGYEEVLLSEEAEFAVEEFILRDALALHRRGVPLSVVKTIREKFDYYEQKILVSPRVKHLKAKW